MPFRVLLSKIWAMQAYVTAIMWRENLESNACGNDQKERQNTIADSRYYIAEYLIYIIKHRYRHIQIYILQSTIAFQFKQSD